MCREMLSCLSVPALPDVNIDTFILFTVGTIASATKFYIFVV